MQALAGFFFQVHTSDSNLLGPGVGCHFDPAVLGQWLVVLRNLIALRQVRIEVVFAREN